MASSLYNTGLEKLVDGTINWDVDPDVRCLLLKSGYTFDADHDFVSELTPASYEITVSGYSRQSCAGLVVNRDDVNNRIEFDLNDVVFSALVAGETIVAAVLYLYNAADAAAQLLAFIDVADTATNGGDITIQWNAEGVWYISVA